MRIDCWIGNVEGFGNFDKVVLVDWWGLGVGVGLRESGRKEVGGGEYGWCFLEVLLWRGENVYGGVFYGIFYFMVELIIFCLFNDGNEWVVM